MHERLLTRTPGSEKLVPIFKSPEITPLVLLSPVSFHAITDNFTTLKQTPRSRAASSQTLKKASDNSFYQYINVSGDDLHSNDSTDYDENNNNNSDNSTDVNIELPRNYKPPSYTPISIDIIDTHAFKPEMVVPFLEVSLFRNLDKSILKGLANQPRQPVSTTSLLVASGASELNGKIDGYILTYSAIPELSHHTVSEPPSYDENEVNNNNNSNNTLDLDNSTNCHDTNLNVSISDSTSSLNVTIDETNLPQGGGLPLLPIIRSCILEAWTEFRNFENNWKLGEEEDVYSLINNLKNLWKSQESELVKLKKMNKLRTFKTQLNSINLDPSHPDSPPPFLIVCTHVNDPMASPTLIETGKQLATQWNSGFVGVDNLDDINVDVALSALIKDIVEKSKLLKKNEELYGNSRHSHRLKLSNTLDERSRSLSPKVFKNLMK